MRKESRKEFLYWKQSGTNRVTIKHEVGHEREPLVATDLFDKLLFNVEVMKAENSEYHELKFIVSMECENGFKIDRHKRYYMPVIDNCSVRISLMGVHGTKFSKRFHVKTEPEYEFTDQYAPKTYTLAKYQDLNLFNKVNFEPLQQTTTYITLEVFGWFSVATVVPNRPFQMVDLTTLHTNGSGMTVESAATFPQICGLPFPMNQSRSGFNTESSPSDVKFIFSSETFEPIEAHSYILAAQSMVFRKMLFEVDMKEKQSKTIRISDASPEIMQTFIRLVYRDCTSEDLINIPVPELLQIFALGHKYAVNDVIEFCKLAIMCKNNDGFTKEDVAEIVQLSRLCGCQDLTTRCCQWLEWKNTDKGEKEQVEEFLSDAHPSFVREFCKYLLKK